MNSYKQLDNLCKDFNGTGVTGYIEDMTRTSDGSKFVTGWRDDYKDLKHYRYIRNSIAHDNNSDEESLCSAEDTAWVEDFYQRIIDRKDPLALYRQATAERTAQAVPQSAAKSSGDSGKNGGKRSGKRSGKRRSYSAGLAAAVLILAAAILFIIIYYFL